MKLRKIVLLFIIMLTTFMLFGMAVTYRSLENTSWQLNYLILHNERQANHSFQRPSLHFAKLAISGNDGCNDFTGDYLPLVFGRFIIISTESTLLGCTIVDRQSGEEINVNIHAQQFMEAVQRANRMKIDGQTMRVYFGEGESDVLVLERIP